MIQKSKYKGKRYGRKILATLLITAAITVTNIHTQAETNVKYINYTVEQGDSIDEIAKQHNIFKDYREMVFEIRKLNDEKDCIIYPGQVLKIPISNN